MFSSGTRVVVLASSVSKGLCPKINSIGYVIGASEAYLTKFDDDGNVKHFLISHVGVMFSRYGNEERRRCEHRPLVNVIPFPDDLTSTNVNKILKSFVNGELKGNPYWRKEVRGMMTEDYRTPIAVIAPAGEFRIDRLRTSESPETKAWMESLLRDPGFLQSAYDRMAFTDNTVKTSGPGNHDILRWICESRYSRKNKLDLINWAVSHTENIIKVIRLMRTVQAVAQRRHNMNDLSFFEAHLKKGIFKQDRSRLSRYRLFLAKYATRYFEPCSSEIKEMMVGKEKGSDELKDLVARMHLAKKSILSLVPQQN